MASAKKTKKPLTPGQEPKAGRRARPSAPAGSEATPKATGLAENPSAGEDEVAPAEIVEPEPELLEAEPEETTARPLPPALVRAGERELARSDPLQVYMAEVTRHPLLSREEEHELAVHYRATGDVKAAYRLVAANLRLVVKLAHEYHRNPLSLLDLIQEGNIGLMQAVKKYDPDRGVKLSSYAAWWIRAYILRYIMDNWKMVKLGTTEAQRKLFFKLRQEQDRLISQGFEASPRLLAERLNVSEQDVVEMDQRLGQDEVYLDAPISEDNRASRGERMLSSGAAPADERLANEQLKQIFRERLSEFAKTLQDKERFIFEKRLTSDEPLTLQDIGDHYGVSRERARQIEANLVNRIREYLRERMPDFDLVAMPKS